MKSQGPDTRRVPGRWLAQDRRIEEVLSVNKNLRLRAALATPRASLQRWRFGALFEILCGVSCAPRTGSFIYAHLTELRFVLPAGAMHLWLLGTVVTAVIRFVRAGAIDYDAPVLELQRQLEALRVFTLRSLRLMFAFGVPILGVPFSIVAAQAWLGIDAYALIDSGVLLAMFAASVVLGLGFLAVCAVCALCASRLHRSPRLRRIARSLSGYNLAVAEAQLAKLAALELTKTAT
jgi:hypothetical protein